MADKSTLELVKSEARNLLELWHLIREMEDALGSADQIADEDLRRNLEQSLTFMMTKLPVMLNPPLRSAFCLIALLTHRQLSGVELSQELKLGHSYVRQLVLAIRRGGVVISEVPVKGAEGKLGAPRKELFISVERQKS